MFVGAETVADVTYDVARTRLEYLVRRGWIAAASGDAYADWGRGLARVGPLGPTPGLSRLVEVRFQPVVTHESSAVLALRWEVVGSGGGLFPVLDADITLMPYGEQRTLLLLRGAYRPPLGVIGAALDRAVLHRVATATVQRFANHIGAALARPASALAPESACGAPSCLNIPE